MSDAFGSAVSLGNGIVQTPIGTGTGPDDPPPGDPGTGDVPPPYVPPPPPVVVPPGGGPGPGTPPPGPGNPPPGGSDWTSRPAFLARTASATLLYQGLSGFSVSAKAFANQIGHDVVSIRLENCSNFQILDVDFDNCTEPLFLYNCQDFELGWLRARNIVGPSQRDGTHRGNLVQMDTCTQFHIHDCKVLHGDTEDVISMFNSGGRSASSMSVVERVNMDMTGWTSGSGTGIILGDGGGSGYIEVRYCTLLNPGQVGIQIIDGPGHKVHDNFLYSARPQVAPPNVAISSYAGNPQAVVSANHVKWFKNDGSENPFYWGAGQIIDGGNDWHAPITAADLAVSL